MKNLITRSITGVIFVAVVVTCFLRPETMILVFALVTGLTVWEYTGLISKHADGQVNRFITTAAGVYLFFAMAGYCSGITPPTVFIPYLLTVVYLFISELYLAAPNPIHNWAYTMLSQMYIALPFSMINVLAFRTDGQGDTLFTPLLPLSVFIFLWINDTGAYLSGSLLGKHKLFPRISPGKSWEGSMGGGVLVVAVAARMGWLERHRSHGQRVFHYPAVDGAWSHSSVLRHMGRPRRVALQAHIRHQGQRQHTPRTRRHARPLRLLAHGSPSSSGLRIYPHLFRLSITLPCTTKGQATHD